MYSGVPLMEVSTIVLQDMARAKPKSHSLTTPLAPMRMFWGCSTSSRDVRLTQMG